MWKMRKVRELSNMGGIKKCEQEEEGEMGVFRSGRANREPEEEYQTSEF